MNRLFKTKCGRFTAAGVLVAVLAGLTMFAVGQTEAAQKIVMEGSTTVLPIAQRTAEVFMDENPGVDISVRGGGSSVGIASLIDGTCDIADASRAMKSSEVETAVERGIDPKAHVVAMDGIAVIVNNSNSLSGLTKKQIKDIYTGKVSDWSVVGGNGGKIVVVSRDTSSGTFEAFGELILEKEKVRADALMEASNQAVVNVVSSTPGAIGYVGLAYLSDKIKALTVNGVTVSKETVLKGEYPVSRPLFMYTNGEPQDDVKEYMDFVKSPQGQKIVEEEGFVGLT